MAKLLRERLNFSKVPPVLDVPYLVEFQRKSFDRFLQKDVVPEERTDDGLQAAFSSVFPITDYNDTTSIEFISYILSEAKISPRECILKGITYAAPLKIKVKLNIWEKDDKGVRILKESRGQEVYIGEMPVMTDTGSFIINGIERVIVSQLHRSPGVYFAPDKSKTHASGRLLYTARVIPVRGSWLDFEFDSKDMLYVRIDRRRKLPATVVLKALGYSNEELLKTFYPVETIRILDKEHFTRDISHVLSGIRSKYNITAPDTGEVIVKEGSKITKLSLKKIEQCGIKEIAIAHADIIGRVTLTDIVDPNTGEIVLDSNKEITEEIFQKILAAGIKSLNLLLPTRSRPRKRPSRRSTRN
jgi:DNA-directed RNA polymerase subunit beta